MTTIAAADGASEPSAAHLSHRLPAALGDLLGRQVLDVCSDRPRVAERILDGAEAVAPELFRDLHQNLGAGIDCLLHDAVDILDVHEETLVPPSSFGGFVDACGNGSESITRESPTSSSAWPIVPPGASIRTSSFAPNTFL